MKSQCHNVMDWDFSFWFALLSPLIGILLGFLGAFLLLR
jgi:ABC-type Mn2+/Zn2+ transport system permease subunit